MFITIFIGCANNQHTVYLKNGYRVSYDKHYAEETNQFIFGGLFQNKITDACVMCIDKGFDFVTGVVAEQRWYHTALTFLTLGVYSPRITYVWCGRSVK